MSEDVGLKVSRTITDRQREQIKEHNRKYKARIQQYLWDLKSSTPCADCDKQYPYYVMQFDHIDEKTVKGGMGYMWKNKWSMEKVRAEVARCEIVCANCHAQRTFSRLGLADRAARC